MRAIVIGAGRGRRLMPLTAEAPKCFAPVAGKRLLEALARRIAQDERVAQGQRLRPLAARA